IAALGFAETAHFYGTKARVTGLPVRRAFFDIPPRPHSLSGPSQTEPVQPLTVLVVGGSQGSRAINQAVMEAVPLLVPGTASATAPQSMALARGIRIIHQTGERDYNEVRKTCQERGLVVEVYAFIDDMPGARAQADLGVSRAGANA